MKESIVHLDNHHAEHKWRHKYPKPPSLTSLGLDQLEEQQKRKSGSALAKMKKFRFQLLHDWLIEHFAPCCVADIGGGKGLLTYLLRQSGWKATVVDPHPQPLPVKYRDLHTGKRVRIAATERVPRIGRSFEPSMGELFDLLVGIHAHGCNMKIIEAASAYGCSFVLIPCCVIDEPALPTPNVHWLRWLADYAIEQGFDVKFFRLNFKGQCIGFFAKRRTGYA